MFKYVIVCLNGTVNNDDCVLLDIQKRTLGSQPISLRLSQEWSQVIRWLPLLRSNSSNRWRNRYIGVTRKHAYTNVFLDDFVDKQFSVYFVYKSCNSICTIYVCFPVPR